MNTAAIDAPKTVPYPGYEVGDVYSGSDEEESTMTASCHQATALLSSASKKVNNVSSLSKNIAIDFEPALAEADTGTILTQKCENSKVTGQKSHEKVKKATAKMFSRSSKKTSTQLKRNNFFSANAASDNKTDIFQLRDSALGPWQ